MGKRKRTKPKFNSKTKNPYKRKSKYTIEQKRSYWTGYGIALERQFGRWPGDTRGDTHLETGWVGSISSAQAGYDKAMSLKDNDFDRNKPFYPKDMRG